MAVQSGLPDYVFLRRPLSRSPDRKVRTGQQPSEHHFMPRLAVVTGPCDRAITTRDKQPFVVSSRQRAAASAHGGIR